MKIDLNQEIEGYISFFVILTVLMLSAGIAVASPNSLPAVNGVNGVDGIDGSDGLDGRNGVDGLNGRDAPYPSNATELSRGIAVAGALSQIPALSHVGKHNHTGMGMSAASYDSQNAIAIGLLHQENNRSYKATIGLSGSSRIIGGGASWAF